MEYLNIFLYAACMIVCIFDIITQKITNIKPWGKFMKVFYVLIIIAFYIDLMERQWAKL